jgi:hypothetical protein
MITYTGYTPVRRQADGEMVAAFRVDHPEWANRVRTLFTSVRNEADRVGAT